MVEQGKAKPTDLYDIVTNRGFAAPRASSLLSRFSTAEMMAVTRGCEASSPEVCLGLSIMEPRAVGASARVSASAR